MRPLLSVRGTKMSGNKAAPAVQLQVAQYRFGPIPSSAWKRLPPSSSPAPYSSAGILIKSEMKHTVMVRTHLYVADQLKLEELATSWDIVGCSPLTGYPCHQVHPRCGFQRVVHSLRDGDLGEVLEGQVLWKSKPILVAVGNLARIR
jgi:hypothetical protein